MEKATSGQPFRVPPAGIWNGMVAAGLAHTSRAELGQAAGGVGRALDGNAVILRNDSGGNLVAGRVLEVGAALVTTPTDDAPYFEGDTPAPDGLDNIAVTLFPARTSGLVECRLAGRVRCRINVNHVQHAYADVDSGSTLLQSKWHGRARILWKSTGSTGEQDAIVLLGEMFRGPINCVATSGITAGSSAACAVHWAGAAASPAANITVWLNWMDGGNNLASSRELQAWWHPDQQKYIAGNVEC